MMHAQERIHSFRLKRGPRSANKERADLFYF